MSENRTIDTSPENAKRLAQMAWRMRLNGLEMAITTGSAGSHLGGSFSCEEILAVLYGEVMHFDVKNPTDSNRDRFLPSKNHCVLAQFPALAEVGFISKDETLEFQKNGGRLTGYPQRLEVGLEYSGGSLGMAISVGIGMSIAAKEQKRDSQIYVLMGDGELDEGSIWEAFMSAPRFGVDNLTAIIDRNHLSYDGDTEELMPLENLVDKFKAFNWDVTCCDGHDTQDLLKAFNSRMAGKPHMIVADTVKGKGVSFMENKPEWHHHGLTQAQYEQAKEEIMKEQVL